MPSITRALVLTTSMTAALAACGGGEKGDGGNATEGSAKDAAAAASEVSVQTAAVPESPCEWIPVSEVEAILGKLAEPPTREDGCRYTMVMPESVSVRRQETIAKREQLNAKLKAAFKDYQPPDFHGPMAEYERDPRSYAVTLQVDVTGSVAGELGAAAAGKVLESWLPPQESDGQPAKQAPPQPEGWDAQLPAPYGFAGRSGHLQISVMGQAPDVPHELSQAFAARVRDRIADLPFPALSAYQVPILKEGGAPCDLLTRAEAEAVLGPLLVEPYRSSSQHPPLALGDGHACAYYTAGHHVFVLSPTWSGGKETFNVDAGVGGLVGMVAPQENVVFKGPWDEAHVSSGTGALMFLKGDRLLEVHYLTSSTDRGGAVKLAAQAMQRL